MLNQREFNVFYAPVRYESDRTECRQSLASSHLSVSVMSCQIEERKYFLSHRGKAHYHLKMNNLENKILPASLKPTQGCLPRAPPTFGVRDPVMKRRFELA